jgi:hypothetical protein
MKFHLTVLILVILLLASSSTAKAQQPNAQDVSYCDLIRNPTSFYGKLIRVRAIYKYAFEIQRLDGPECCPEKPKDKIWVEIFPDDLNHNSRKLFRKFHEGTGIAFATFTGTFQGGGPFGDGGYRFQFTVNKIEKLEGTSNSSAGHPPWLPQNCL